MQPFLLVFLGGGLGAVGRYVLGLCMTRLMGPGLPWGTLVVNVLGALAMGLLVGWLAHRGGVHQDRLRLLLAVGVLGGFTTFSSYSLEIVLMIERKAFGPAAAYALGSVLFSVGALMLGLIAARRAFA